MYKKEEKERILMLAESCTGKTFGEIDQTNILEEKGNKGALGHVIEVNVFNYDRNSNPEKDFVLAGLELKVTPYRQNKNGTFSAKERLVLNMMDYYKDYDKDFYSSSFWQKNSELLIMFYRYEQFLSRKKYTITHILDFSYSKKDLVIIRQDYEYIQNKIRIGNAHLLSEGDTMFLGACTKGATSKTKRAQPFSGILAPQRAYSLKTTYMTQILRKKIFGSEEETIFIDQTIYENLNFEQNIKRRVDKYFGMSQKELTELFDVSLKAKNINELLFSRMLGINGKVSGTDEFLKANIIPKTIRVKEDNTIKESMSFPAFEFKEIYQQSWDESKIKEYFETTKFLLIIFRFNSENQLIFDNIKLWNIPIEIIESSIKSVYLKLREVIKSGYIVKNITSKGIYFNNFPGITFNGICHIRPHARNKYDVFELPVKDKLTGLEAYTKQCFWLNNTYVESLL